MGKRVEDFVWNHRVFRFVGLGFVQQLVMVFVESKY